LLDFVVWLGEIVFFLLLTIPTCHCYRGTIWDDDWNGFREDTWRSAADVFEEGCGLKARCTKQFGLHPTFHSYKVPLSVPKCLVLSDSWMVKAEANMNLNWGLSNNPGKCPVLPMSEQHTCKSFHLLLYVFPLPTQFKHVYLPHLWDEACENQPDQSFDFGLELELGLYSLHFLVVWI
jgi:hypothetical protein